MRHLLVDKCTIKYKIILFNAGGISDKTNGYRPTGQMSIDLTCVDVI